MFPTDLPHQRLAPGPRTPPLAEPLSRRNSEELFPSPRSGSFPQLFTQPGDLIIGRGGPLTATCISPNFPETTLPYQNSMPYVWPAPLRPAPSGSQSKAPSGPRTLKPAAGIPMPSTPLYSSPRLQPLSPPASPPPQFNSLVMDSQAVFMLVHSRLLPPVLPPLGSPWRPFHQPTIAPTAVAALRTPIQQGIAPAIEAKQCLGCGKPYPPDYSRSNTSTRWYMVNDFFGEDGELRSFVSKYTTVNDAEYVRCEKCYRAFSDEKWKMLERQKRREELERRKRRRSKLL